MSRSLLLPALVVLLVGLGFATVGTGRAFALPSHGFPTQAASPTIDSTATSVISTFGGIAPGTTVKVTAYVTDTSATPSTPSGTVSWSDEGAGGTFSAPECTLDGTGPGQSDCSVSYLDAAPVGSVVTIVGSYAGDETHEPSSSAATLTVLSASTTSVSPNSLSVLSGQAVNYTVTVTDTSNGPASAPQGDVSWADGGAGGSFSASVCSLSATNNFTSTCTITYQAPGTTLDSLKVKITATYPGDALHLSSSGGASLTVLPAVVEVTVNYVTFGSGNASAPPTFTFSASNGTDTVLLTLTPTSYGVEVDTPWFVSSQLGNSSQTDAWNLKGVAQGTVQYASGGPNGQSSLTFVYYHQYSVDLGYTVVGGTSGASVPPFVTYTSFGVKHDVGAPGRVWVDVGTAYAYPASLPGSIGSTRWLAQGVNGTVTGPGDLSPTYYHQYDLSVSYSVQDSPADQTPPTFFAQSMGSPFNASLATLTSKVWLDAGSTYSFTDPLAGATATERWSAGSGSSGTVTDADIAITYYQQNPVLASFNVNDGSTPAESESGHATPVFATLEGVAGDGNVTATLSTQPQEVWLNAGTHYSIPNILLALPGERWVATGAVTGTVALGATVTQTYYHEFLLNASFSSVGPPAPAPELTYTELGNETQSPLIEHNPIIANSSSFWVDAGTRFFVSDSASGDRWFAPAAPTELASSNMTVMFFHQYEVEVSLQVTSGGVPGQVALLGVSGGAPFSQLLGPQPVGVWLDSGTSYTIPQTLLQLSTERWVAASNLTGIASSPSNVTQLYYHQALLNLSASGAPSDPSPTVEYTAHGQAEETAVGQAGSGVWADVGTKFTLQNVIPISAGARWYSPLVGGNLTGPVQETARFYQQYLLAYSYNATGGNMTPPLALALVQGGSARLLAISNQTGHIWADARTAWSVTAAPSQGGERWLTSSATQGTVGGPATLSLSFVHQFLVTTAPSPPTGGSVTLGGWYNASSEIAIQATPAQGWGLGAWSGVGNSSYSGTSSTLSIQVLSPVNETAQFDPSLTIVSSNGGSVKYTTGPSVQSIDSGRSAQTYVVGGGKVTLQAHASFPYVFVKWSGIDSNSSDPLSLNVTAPTVIQAVFAPSYIDLIGLPVLVLVCCLSIYLTRHVIAATGRQVLRNLTSREG